MKWKNCTKFLQYLALLLAIIIPIIGQEDGSKTVTRGPASYVPRDDIEVVPVKLSSWVESILAEDGSGVMSNTVNTFNNWNKRESYAKLWNLKSTGHYGTPDENYRRRFFKKQLLRYLDKRITGGIRKAKKESPLYSVARMQNALRPRTEATISKNIKLKFKARVLRGKMIMNVVNPWVHYSTEFSATGAIHMSLNKKIEWADVTASFNYRVEDDTLVAQFDKPLSEHILARLSSRQPAASNNFDNTWQLLYNKGF